MDVYHYIPVECLPDFVDFELQFNNFLCVRGYVLSQHRGVPMGGKVSSQLSSLFLMCKEMHNTHISLFGSAMFHTRYKDSIYVCEPPGTVFRFMLLWCDTLSTRYTLPVQVKGYWSDMNVLESTIRVTNKGLSMTVRCKTLELSGLNSKPYRRLPEPWFLNCGSAMKSLASGCASRCPLWALSASDVATNARSVCTELGCKTIRTVIPHLCHALQRGGVLVDVGDLQAAWWRGYTWWWHIADVLL